MIGHFLLSLTPEEEDRVLTSRLRPGGMAFPDGTRCLVGAVEGWTWEALTYRRLTSGIEVAPRTAHHTVMMWWAAETSTVASRFDQLCERFGVERVGRAIRERILANQARRELSRQREAVAI